MKILLAPKEPNLLPETYAPASQPRLVLASGGPRTWLEEVRRAADHRTQAGSKGHGGISHPLPSLSGAGCSPGKRSGSSGSTRLVAQARLPIPFNTSRASYLRVASPGFPPAPGPAQPRRKRSLKLLKSGEFQSERSRRDLNPSPQRGRGQEAAGGGGRGSSLPKGEEKQYGPTPDPT